MHKKAYTDCFELLGLLNEAEEQEKKNNFKEAYKAYLYVIEGYKVLANREKSKDNKKKLMNQVDGFVKKAKELRSKLRQKKKKKYLPKAKEIHKVAYEADKKKDYRVALKYYVKCTDYYTKHIHAEKDKEVEVKYSAVINKILDRVDVIKLAQNSAMNQISIDFGGLSKLDAKNFTFESEIGKGSFGTVKKMRMKLKKGSIYVAVKEFKLLNTVEAKSIENEIKIMKQLKHPNIVRIFGYFQEGAKFSLVMEYMSGGDLYQFIRKQTLSNYDKWIIIKMCIEAISHLHSNQIIHRDLKSLNFLVSYHQKSIKLSDFGISTIKMNTIAPGSTKENIGTARFMAPEIIITKTPKYSMKSDIYALGMTIYEICTRKAPFENQKDDTSVLCMVKYEDQRPEMSELVPEHFKYIIEKCWNKDPFARPDASKLLTFMNVNEPEFFKFFPASEAQFFKKKRK